VSKHGSRPVNFGGVLAASIRWVGAAQTPASAIAYSLMSRLSIILVNVATGILIARTLGPSNRGAAAAITLWPLVISGLLTLGLPAALAYEIRRKAGSAADLFSSALLLSAILGACAFAIGFAIVPRVLFQYPRPVIVFAQVMMLFAPIILVTLTLRAFYESRGDFKQSNALSYVPPLMTLAGLLVLLILHKLSAYSVAVAYEAPFALTTVVTLFRLRHFIRLPEKFAQHARLLLHYGVRAYGIDMLNTLAAQIDQAMVIGLLSPASFGFYVVAINGARILSVLGNSLNSVLFPTASGLDSARAVSLVSRSARMVFACTLLAAVIFVAALPVLVPLTYGKEYLSVIGLIRLLTIAVVFGTTTSTFTQAFMATGRPEIATVLQCVGVCITPPLMLALIPKFGLTGAAYAIDISNALRFGLVMISYAVFLRVGIPRLLPTLQDIRDLCGRLRHVAAS
jgi:O-antigen/teichoic acid export membrane protein